MIKIDFSSQGFTKEQIEVLMNPNAGISDIKITKEWADKKWIELVSKGKVNSLKTPINDDDKVWLQKIEPYKKEKKYFLKEVDVFWSSIGEIWMESFSLLGELLGRDRKHIFKQRMEELSLLQHKSHEAIVDTLKGMGEYAKKTGPHWDVDWKNYVDLNNCWKYGSYYTDEDIMEKLKGWFSRKMMKSVRPDTYYKYFKKAVKKFFDMHWKRNKNVQGMSWREFIYSGNWGTTGSSELGNVRIQYEDGKIVDAKRTKNMTNVGYDKDKLVNMINEHNPQVNVATVKPDEAPNKTRLIVSSDMANYMLQSYISGWLENQLLGSASTLYMSLNEMVIFWVKVLHSCLSNSIHMPLDQKNFDWHATAEMIWLVMDGIDRVTLQG